MIRNAAVALLVLAVLAVPPVAPAGAVPDPAFAVLMVKRPFGDSPGGAYFGSAVLVAQDTGLAALDRPPRVGQAVYLWPMNAARAAGRITGMALGIGPYVVRAAVTGWAGGPDGQGIARLRLEAPLSPALRIAPLPTAHVDLRGRTVLAVGDQWATLRTVRIGRDGAIAQVRGEVVSGPLLDAGDGRTLIGFALAHRAVPLPTAYETTWPDPGPEPVAAPPLLALGLRPVEALVLRLLEQPGPLSGPVLEALARRLTACGVAVRDDAAVTATVTVTTRQVLAVDRPGHVERVIASVTVSQPPQPPQTVTLTVALPVEASPREIADALMLHGLNGLCPPR